MSHALLSGCLFLLSRALFQPVPQAAGHPYRLSHHNASNRSGCHQGYKHKGAAPPSLANDSRLAHLPSRTCPGKASRARKRCSSRRSSWQWWSSPRPRLSSSRNHAHPRGPPCGRRMRRSRTGGSASAAWWSPCGASRSGPARDPSRRKTTASRRCGAPPASIHRHFFGVSVLG